MKALAIPERISPEVDERDVEVYRRITSTELTEEEKERIRSPSRVYPRQDSVLALHWHPEFVPLELAVERVEAMFPNAEDTLVIPTQHNVPLEWRGYTGVEVDSYSPGFQRKVQILFHFSAEKLRNRGDVFRAMCAHTRKYRASQLHELIESLLESKFSDRVEEAAEATGATDEIVGFVQAHVSRLKSMMERFESSTPPQMLKNKLIRNYFDALRDRYDDRLINHIKLFVKAVKKIVKARFSLEYFYETRQIIEEARSLGGGVVIPHPEQFWPILLDDLDVDGIEVWNPQSFQYTNFLIDVVYRQNKSSDRRRRLLVTMGDDCHLGEKVKDPRYQDPAKAGREVGLQPMWEDLRIRKRLIVADQSRRRVIEEYRGRLDG